MIRFENTRAAGINSSPSMAVSMAAKAMRSGKTRYTNPDGLAALRATIVAKFKRANGLNHAMDQISIGFATSRDNLSITQLR